VITLKRSQEIKRIRTNSAKNENSFIYAKNSNPPIIINGAKISSSAVPNVAYIRRSKLLLYLSFVKTKKCKSTMARSPNTKICGNTILRIPPALCDGINFSSFPM